MSDTKHFLETIGSFATGVTVITTEHAGHAHGMTATAVTSLSVNPMLIVICVSKKAKMAAYLTVGHPFTVNILREEQAAISNHFAGALKKQEHAPEFKFIHWACGPRLDGCLAAIGCDMLERVDGGDHWIVVGRVAQLFQGPEPRKPLLYFRGRYGTLETGGPLAPSRDDLNEGTPQIYYDW